MNIWFPLAWSKQRVQSLPNPIGIPVLHLFRTNAIFKIHAATKLYSCFFFSAGLAGVVQTVLLSEMASRPLSPLLRPFHNLSDDIDSTPSLNTR